MAEQNTTSWMASKSTNLTKIHWIKLVLDMYCCWMNFRTGTIPFKYFRLILSKVVVEFLQENSLHFAEHWIGNATYWIEDDHPNWSRYTKLSNFIGRLSAMKVMWNRLGCDPMKIGSPQVIGMVESLLNISHSSVAQCGTNQSEAEWNSGEERRGAAGLPLLTETSFRFLQRRWLGVRLS